MALAPIKSLVHKEQKLFVWRYLSAKQKMVSLRPRRLSGENLILDKYAVIFFAILNLFLTSLLLDLPAIQTLDSKCLEGYFLSNRS